MTIPPTPCAAVKRGPRIAALIAVIALCGLSAAGLSACDGRRSETPAEPSAADPASSDGAAAADGAELAAPANVPSGGPAETPDSNAAPLPDAAGPSASAAADPAAAEPRADEPGAAASVAPADPDLAVLIGDVDPRASDRLTAIPTQLASRAGMFADRDALQAFQRMRAAAKADGIELRIVSAFRSFRDQKRIWEDKWTGRTLVEGGALPETTPDPAARARKILEFSSMPATSRHHWGTDFDLNNLNNSYFASGTGKAVHDWLAAHAADYGFCQVYSPKGAQRPSGYEREDWHWSYLPVASLYLARYADVVSYDHVEGFAGAETARDIDVIANYVQGIDPACRR